jgi:hypothetical protein
MPFAFFMFFVRTRDLYSIYDEFAHAVMPPLKKRRLNSKLTESEFRELSEYLTQTFMLKSETIEEIIENV